MGKLFYTPSHLVDNWVESTLRDEGSKFLTGIPDFDKELNGDLRGKFVALIGAAGSAKSMFGLQVSVGNSIDTDTVGIFANCEMSENNLFDRILDFNYGLQGGGGDRASVYFKECLTEGNAESYKKKLKDNLNSTYKDNLLITTSTKLEDMVKGLEELQSEGKNIAGLVIDSSSMMVSKGNNVESAEHYAKSFKSIANRFNICVLVIYHIPKSIELDKRDLSSSAKDSVTIINNCDLTISFSAILDEDGKKVNDLKYLQLFNKRGSGNYVDKVCRVNKSHLVLEPTELDPNVFPERDITKF